MIYVIGGRGLTGSAIVRYAELNGLEYKIIQRENKDEFLGTSCDVLIYANGNAFKYKAAADPYFDFEASVGSVAQYVHGIDFGFFIHLSTVDVYSDTSDTETTSEDASVDVMKLAPYGFHKLMAEDYVRRYCSRHLIFRLPGLVGPGLKKNPAYDFMHDHKEVMISPDSEMNFIHTDTVAANVFGILDRGVFNETFNLCSINSIRIEEIGDIVGYSSKYSEQCRQYVQTYRINCEKIQGVGSISTSQEALVRYGRELQGQS